jgi:ABC-2 type transport system permease protein
MKKVALVLRYELMSTLRRRSFLFVAFGIPLIAMLIFAVVKVIQSDSGGPAGAGVEETYEFEAEGYVDESGLIKEIPKDMPQGVLVSFSDEVRAQEALAGGEIAAFYIIPEDFLERGELIYVTANHTPASSGGQDWLMRSALIVNMLGGDEVLAGMIWSPMDLTETDLSVQEGAAGQVGDDCTRPNAACDSVVLARILPNIIVILFFVFLSTGSGLLIRGVSNEKQNQVMEILMISLKPWQLMAGKVIGLGIAGLMQMIAWFGTLFFIMGVGKSLLNLPPGFALPTSLLTWGIVYFILGYGIYATLMAGAGALIPDSKAMSQATWVVMLPLFVGYFIALMPVEIAEPNGPLATVLSLFPLTAPVVMIMRLTVGGMPFWHPILGAVLMALSMVFIIRGVGKMFRAQNLLSGQPFSARRYLRALVS